jgi:hypothetical protein
MSPSKRLFTSTSYLLCRLISIVNTTLSVLSVKILDVEPIANAPLTNTLSYDEEWLAILRSTRKLYPRSKIYPPLPHQEYHFLCFSIVELETYSNFNGFVPLANIVWTNKMLSGLGSYDSPPV